MSMRLDLSGLAQSGQYVLYEYNDSRTVGRVDLEQSIYRTPEPEKKALARAGRLCETAGACGSHREVKEILYAA